MGLQLVACGVFAWSFSFFCVPLPFLYIQCLCNDELLSAILLVDIFTSVICRILFFCFICRSALEMCQLQNDNKNNKNTRIQNNNDQGSSQLLYIDISVTLILYWINFYKLIDSNLFYLCTYAIKNRVIKQNNKSERNNLYA